ncbi:MAG: glutamate synthase-related protein, partial [Actinobacteria bacterium]|nr:glutamate synthase-related protein [Actinomycetota bacterium]
MTESEFEIERDAEKCISCQVCVRQCSNDVHDFDGDDDTVVSNNQNCVGCHRCESMCPTGALKVKERQAQFKTNANWSAQHLRNLYKQADSGGVMLIGMGSDKPYPVYWDHILFNASQVTNPSIDPLREPMEVKTFIGNKSHEMEFEESGDPEGKGKSKDSSGGLSQQKRTRLKLKLSPQLELSSPIIFSAMSYGSISFNACRSLATASSEFGTYYNTGEGGLHKDLYKY